MPTSLLLKCRKYRRCSIKQTPPIILHYSGTNVHQQGKNTLTRHHLLSFLTFFFFFCRNSLWAIVVTLFTVDCSHCSHSVREINMYPEWNISSLKGCIPVHIFKYLNICFYLSVLGHLATSSPLWQRWLTLLCVLVSPCYVTPLNTVC